MLGIGIDWDKDPNEEGGKKKKRRETKIKRILHGGAKIRISFSSCDKNNITKDRS